MHLAEHGENMQTRSGRESLEDNMRSMLGPNDTNRDKPSADASPLPAPVHDPRLIIRAWLPHITSFSLL